ncbi:hypothetical protein VKT23_008604 [Stygiomarasmius scandens]|uniref:Uncharacterized protein n=1 Tax=Marasmiellus scandens TaxID=2682957 RepID=A0ABR1JM77_9AGAR
MKTGIHVITNFGFEMPIRSEVVNLFGTVANFESQYSLSKQHLGEFCRQKL